MFEMVSTTTYCLLAVFLSLLTYILWFYKQAFNYWKSRGLDDLDPIIPFGNAANLYFRKKTMGELFANWYLQFKARGLKHGGGYFFWKPVYIPVDPDIIKRILISDFENFPNHGLYISDKDPLSGHIFNMEDAKWRTLRAKMPVNFTSAKMRKMFLIMEKMTEQFGKILDTYAEPSSPIDIKKELSRFTTDIILACAVGIESNTMKNENEELLKQLRSFFDYQWNIYKNTMVLMVPRNILQKFNFRITTKAAEKYFFEMFRSIKEYKKGNDSRGDLADTLTRLTEFHEEERDFEGENAMEPLTFEEFSAQVFVFFAAGFETSSSTVAFAIYELATHQYCLLKLREEINRVLKNHDGKVAYDAVMEMTYLDNVVDETLRLYPVFPILPRVCINDYQVPGTDFILEKNTLVLVSNMGIQRDPYYYPNPDQFDPSRFSENKTDRPFVSHLPFGEGPRICVGKRFGLLQSKIALITLVRNYDFTLNNKTENGFKFVPEELILRKTGDIWLNITKINT